jgi:hypothetical protein
VGLTYYRSRSASADRWDTRIENARACGTSLHIGETNESGVTVKNISEEESEGKGAGGINGKDKVSSARSARSGSKGRTNLGPRRLRVGFGSAAHWLARMLVLV